VVSSRKPPAALREASPTPLLKSKSKRARLHSSPEQLSLVPTASVDLPSTRLPVIALRQLWLGAYLPLLSLEALVQSSEPAAVFEEQHGIRKILLGNAAAHAAGISPGLSINAALALIPTVQLEERNLAREARVLKDLAEWSEEFTAFTSIEAPSLLLLEIAGSQKLFGGIKPLRKRIVHGFKSQGFHVAIAIAPTPLAATWLAKAGRKVCIRDARNLVGKLGPLPISCLDWPDKVCQSLRGMGVNSIGEALRLPRQGFAKRFGASRLLEFDRATGCMPDPRVNYRGPEHFVADYDLNEEESDAALILNICQKLLAQLEHFLLTRQLAVQHVEFIFFHLQEPATHLSLGCVQADRVAQHWFDLLEIKFDCMNLSAPIIAIQLCGGHGQRFDAETSALPFNREKPQRYNTSMAHLAERLSARIGEEAVHGVMMVAEHRPQYAWRYREAFSDVPKCASTSFYSRSFDTSGIDTPELLADIRRTNSLVLRRPLWMLQAPEPLLTDDNRPCYQGVLLLLDGPERLETGWWDSEGIARDYFVAKTPQGVNLWIYRDRGKNRNASWYLHGMFG
jgi:protein ImuB